MTGRSVAAITERVWNIIRKLACRIQTLPKKQETSFKDGALVFGTQFALTEAALREGRYFMMRIKNYISACSVIVFATASIAVGDTWNKKTILTVNETIQVPGAVLQPGKYVVKLLDSLSNRHIVCITDETEKRVFTTILAIPNYRLQPTGNTQFQWWETPAGSPRALRAWFYPGDNFGQEFAYPKRISIKIAEVAQAPVPTTEAQTPAEMKEAPVTTVDRTGEEKPFVPETYAKATPAPVPVEATPAPEPKPSQLPSELPRTATGLQLLALAGAVTLIVGVGLKRLVTKP